MKKTATQKRGAVLLIAILVASVALAVGLGVYNRTYKELLFASFWKQTQVAFAAADAGIECAMYWDLHPAASASCYNSPLFTWTVVSPGTFTLPDLSSYGVCATITVTKAGSAPVVTTIVARGYNTCDTTNPRRVERGLNVSY